MKTEDELQDTIPQDGLFSDPTTDGGAPMLSGTDYDGAAPSETPTPTPEPVTGKGGKTLLRVDLGNGHFVVGETEREVLEKVVKGKIEADRTILARESELKTLRTQLQAQPPAPTPQPQAKPAEAFDGQKYLTMLGENPLEADRYISKYRDGGPVADDRIDYAYRVAKNVEEQFTAAEFHRKNPDWQPTPENANKMMTLLNSRGLAPTLEHLEWGKFELQRTGQIAPSNTEDGITYEDITFGDPPPNVPRGTQRQSRGGGAPPNPRGTGKTTEVEAVDAATMPLKDLEDLLRKKGALQF